MRILLAVIVSMFVLCGTALAQGYEYKLSGIEFTSSVPIEPGVSVQGLIRQANGLTALGHVYVEGLFYGDLFVYWEGSFKGHYYYYDSYTGYWRPGPVGVEYATLDFQGESLEGFIRTFGPFADTDHFLGRNGILYKRVNIERNRRRNTNRRRQVVYTYFVNMETGERSDGQGQAYLVIGSDSAVQAVTDQIEDAQQALDNLVATDPAYPLWQEEAFDAPLEVATPENLADGVQDSTSLLELIEGEVGPLSVEEEPPVEAETSE